MKCSAKEFECKKEAKLGFVSKNNKLQNSFYCEEHFLIVRHRGAFPRCTQTFLINWKKIGGVWSIK